MPDFTGFLRLDSVKFHARFCKAILAKAQKQAQLAPKLLSLIFIIYSQKACVLWNAIFANATKLIGDNAPYFGRICPHLIA